MENTKKRLLSLDVLRGITVAGMILVNNGGNSTYAPLQHSAWNGLTPCDLVFPFFLFIMGISTYISLNKFNFSFSSHVVLKILKRTFIILCIGWAIAWFHHICDGDFFPFAHLRIPGVLQRIALCYCAASFMALFMKHKFIPVCIAVILIGYALILCLGNGYLYNETNIIAIIDRWLVGEEHLYRKSIIDPEGITSTLPAIAHTMIGFYCGKMIAETKQVDRKVLKLFLIGFIITAAGFLIMYGLPLNKRIWSPSFVLVTCGLASSLLAVLMYYIDIKDKKKWCRFFVIFGVNPLFLYVLSEVLSIILSTSGIYTTIYTAINYLITDNYLASAIYAVTYTLLLGAAGYPLWKRKIYIKI
ncbi:acyltransferase family protein [Bacteroides sp. 519]|uniref:acyltransferase family protein n=1 Tax=Bacteroides sp. 519 TaxID=2302937 RepID=UPI0013D0ED8A|nr:heparan-alpha-glucosaminide N-acetyltransferase domain-containing protein [Bacteroides sp. 519]NDV57727.1 DUF1624 domain-containing protein [Bacteroides sp. 519]